MTKVPQEKEGKILQMHFFKQFSQKFENICLQKSIPKGFTKENPPQPFMIFKRHILFKEKGKKNKHRKSNN